MKPTAVLIDLDNTLYSYSECHAVGITAVEAMLRARFKIGARKIRGAFDEAKIETKKRNSNTPLVHSRISYFQHMLIDLGFAKHPTLALELENLYWSKFLGNMQLKKGINELLAILRYHSVPTILVTDMTSSVQLRKLVRLNLVSSFDLVVTSEMIGAEKVTLKPFIYALERLDNLSKEFVWFIGDEISDVDCVDALKTKKYLKNGRGWRVGTRPLSAEQDLSYTWADIPFLIDEFNRTLRA